MISKKRVLSVAAAVALSSSIATAGYLPLTSDTQHDKWVMFGVAGFHNDGASQGGTGATDPGMFSIVGDAANVAIDDSGVDELYGTNVINKGANAVLGRVKRVDGVASSVQVRVDVSAIAYQETDPVRTIYVKIDEEAATPLFAFSYKSALEGQRLELSTTISGANDNAYFITINSENTYSNPAIAQYIPANDGSGGFEGTPLQAISNSVDYDFTDNPVSSSFYLRADHQTQPTDDDNLRLYSYDPSGIWNIYDSRNTFNDFTELEKGKGYWGKMDLSDAGATPAGFVLGRPSINTQNYIDSGIAEGWNLLAFNGINPDLRVATTGLVIAGGVTADGNIILEDVSGNHSVTIALLTADSEELSARKINNGIKVAKLAGELPDTFHLAAIGNGAGGIVLLSNEKFTVKEGGAGSDATLGAITTLAGETPLNSDTLIGHGGTADVTGVDGAMSKYGEYALVIDNPGNHAYAHLQIRCQGPNNIDDDIDVVPDIGGPAATSDCISTEFELLTIDSGYDRDLILIAGTEPFEIRDHTFTRTFQYTTDDTNAGTLTPLNADTAQTAPIIASIDRDTAVANIIASHADYTATNVLADDTNANNIIIRMRNAGSNEFRIVETGTADNLTPTTTSSLLAKGAVSNVFSPNYFTKVALRNDVEATVADAGAGVAAAGETITIVVSTYYDPGVALAVYTTVADDTIPATFYANLEAHINDELAAKNVNASVSIDNTATPVTFAGAVITVTGPDVIAVPTFTHTGPVLTAVFAADLGALDIANATGDLVDDLKFNFVQSPNYVLNGPLYEMNAAGYKALAMVTGTMNLGTDLVNWDGIDLTRKPSEWLLSQDYNLFTVDSKAGYWTFLETAEPNPLSFEATPFSGNYTQHFDTDGITFNNVAGGIEVTVNGISEYDDKKSARVVAIVGGSEVELSRDGDSNVYTGQISSHELKELVAGEDHDIQIVVADGLGNRIPATATGAVVDFKKPRTPVLTFVDGTTMSLSNPEVDGVTKYYVYDGASATNGHIPATNTEAANLLTITPEAAAAFNICATPSFDRDTAYNLKVFALDGENLSSSNASNVVTVTGYMPLFKNSALITNTKDVGAATTSIAEVKYTSACVQDETFTTDSSIQVSSLTDFATTKVAYEPKVVGDAVMITVHVDGGTENTRIGRITYHPDYVGETVFIQLGTRVYSYELPDDATAVASTEADPIDISDIANNGVYLEGQSLGE